MALNRKLTPILARRTIQSISQSENALSLQFSDGSVAYIKTAGSVSAESLPGRTLKAVRQRGQVMDLDFADGFTAEIKLAEPTSSVLVRDCNRKLEYTD